MRYKRGTTQVRAMNDLSLSQHFGSRTAGERLSITVLTFWNVLLTRVYRNFRPTSVYGQKIPTGIVESTKWKLEQKLRSVSAMF